MCHHHRSVQIVILEVELLDEGECETDGPHRHSLKHNIIECQEECLDNPLCYAMDFVDADSDLKQCRLFTQDTKYLTVKFDLNVNFNKVQCYRRKLSSKNIFLSYS